MPHQEQKIIDPESGKILPRGQPGVLCYRGHHVMRGYYNNEGRPGEGPGWFGGNYGGGAQAFFSILHDWRGQDDFAGLETT